MTRSVTFLSYIFSFVVYTNGFYLPGVKMVTFQKGTRIPVYVNSLTSTKTLLPKEYYTLPFCRPEKIQAVPENLGEYLTANRIQNTPYDIKFLEPLQCKVLCKRTYTPKKMMHFDYAIRHLYLVHWIMDNLPVATESADGVHALGFPVGHFNEELDSQTRLNNHVRIRMGYHIPEGSPATEGRIVDFAAFPSSFAYTAQVPESGNMPECDANNEKTKVLYIDRAQKKDVDIVWTYSVEWVEMKDREWRTRWDVYFELGSGGDNVHWFSIINALLVVFFLSGMVGMILMRSLRKDINRYNRIPTEEEREEEREESGWKLVHADVFRPPAQLSMVFCVAIGTGVQLFGMAAITVLFAAIGFLSPSNRGNLMVAVLVLFVLMGVAGGYASSRCYKMFKGKRWQLNTTLTALLFPGAMFTMFFMLNLFVWGAGSDAAVPFGSMILVVFLWFGISVPLVFAGAWLGYRKPMIEFPVSTSNIPRPIPEQIWYMTTLVSCVVGGVLPFGAIFVELYFVLTSLWTDKYYYVFGFLLLAFVILIGTCAEITIVLCYFQLCAEDYNWWWRSFLVSGSCGIYVFAYSAYYYCTRLDVNNLIGTMLYFGYMAVISGALSLMTGTVGYFSTLWFNKKIYASIKVD